MRARFQFSLSFVFWAIFWVAMLLSIWKVIGYLDLSGIPIPFFDHLRQTFISTSAMFILAWYGARTGQPKTWAVIGVIAALFVALWLSPTIY
jgi:hypothetical protein